MKIEDLKKLDPFQVILVMTLDRIASALENLVENDRAL